jgi:hypothetical protein
MTYAVTLALLALALRAQGSAYIVQACVHVQYPLLCILVEKTTCSYQRIAVWRAPPCTMHEQYCRFTKHTWPCKYCIVAMCAYLVHEVFATTMLPPPHVLPSAAVQS